MDHVLLVGILIIIALYMFTTTNGSQGKLYGASLNHVHEVSPRNYESSRRKWPAPIAQIQDYGRAVGDAQATPEVRTTLQSTPMPMSGPLFMQYNNPVEYQKLMQQQVPGPTPAANHWQSWLSKQSYANDRRADQLSPNLPDHLTFEACEAAINSEDPAIRQHAAQILRGRLVGDFYSAGEMRIFIKHAAPGSLKRLAGHLWSSPEQVNDGQLRVMPFIDNSREAQLIVHQPEGLRSVVHVDQPVHAGDLLVVELHGTTNSDMNGFICRMYCAGERLCSGAEPLMSRLTGGFVLCANPNPTMSEALGARWIWPVGCFMTQCTTKAVLRIS